MDHKKTIAGRGLVRRLTDAIASPKGHVTAKSGLIVPESAKRTRKAMTKEAWTSIVRASRLCDAEAITFALYCKDCNHRILPRRSANGTTWTLICECHDREIV